MATEDERSYKVQAEGVEGYFRDEDNMYQPPKRSSETFNKENIDEQNVTSSSSYIVASHSQISGDVDRWIRGCSMENMGVQNSRVQLVQRSTLATTASLGVPSMWYVLAMVLPLFSVNTTEPNSRQCDPSTILTNAGLLYTQIAVIYEDLKSRMRRLAVDHLAQELFATFMDVVLTVYAVGFLILSLYQASIIG